MRIIDTHAHFGRGRHYRVAIDRLLAEMDRLGIEKSFLCAGDMDMAANGEARLAVGAGLKRRYPSRFLLWADVNPWDKTRAIQRIRRAMRMGYDGLKLNGHLHGYRISDEMVDPVIAAVKTSRWPVYVHTGTPITSEPMQLAALAERHPGINFIMGHTGFADFWYDVVEVMKRCGNIYAETSFAVPGVLKTALAEVGASRVLFGSDYPVGHLEVELDKVANLGLSPADLSQVMAGNIGGLCQA